MEKVKITNGSITFAVLFVAALIVAYYARFVVLLSLIGIGLGVLFVPFLQLLRKKLHLPKAVSALILLLGISLLTLLVLGSLYYVLSDQISSLSQKFPSIMQIVNDWLLNMFDTYPWLKGQLQKLNLARSVNTSLMSVYKGFQTGIMIISSAAFAVIIGLYTAVDGESLFSSAVEAFPPRHRPRASEVMKNCAQVLREWLKAQALDLAIIGSLTAVGLWAVGVEYWAVFGLLTAVVGIIPYVGIFLIVIVASLITLASDPGKVPWVIGIFLVTQQLKGNLILPLIMRGKAELPVVPLLIFMLFLGTFFGLIGILMAPALLAIIRSLYKDLYLKREGQYEKAH